MATYPVTVTAMLSSYNEYAYHSFLSFEKLVRRLVEWLWTWKPTRRVDSAPELAPRSGVGSEAEKSAVSLSINKSDLRYLTVEEAGQIIALFESIPCCSDRLLFWTGLPRDWVQRWADDHDFLTLSSAMGPLMDDTGPICPKKQMGPWLWSRYVKGASGIFSRFACTCGVIRVLTVPPSESWRLRPDSSYRAIEEPVLKGAKGCNHALRINFVHLLSDSRELEYEVWPDDHTYQWFQSRSIGPSGDLDFLLPPPRSNALGKRAKRRRRSKSSVRVVAASDNTQSTVLRGVVHQSTTVARSETECKRKHASSVVKRLKKAGEGDRSCNERSGVEVKYQQGVNMTGTDGNPNAKQVGNQSLASPQQKQSKATRSIKKGSGELNSVSIGDRVVVEKVLSPLAKNSKPLETGAGKTKRNGKKGPKNNATDEQKEKKKKAKAKAKKDGRRRSFKEKIGTCGLAGTR
ncbi:hypothetical protein Q7P37_009749 [Cladosporium fusiforme]